MSISGRKNSSSSINGGLLDLSAIGSNVIPSLPDYYDLGAQNTPFKNLYVDTLTARTIQAVTKAEIKDIIVALAVGNPADTQNIGIQLESYSGTTGYHGILRDYKDGVFKFVHNVPNELTSQEIGTMALASIKVSGAQVSSGTIDSLFCSSMSVLGGTGNINVNNSLNLATNSLTCGSCYATSVSCASLGSTGAINVGNDMNFGTNSLSLNSLTCSSIGSTGASLIINSNIGMTGYTVNCLSLSAGSLSSGGTGSINVSSNLSFGTNSLLCSSFLGGTNSINVSSNLSLGTNSLSLNSLTASSIGGGTGTFSVNSNIGMTGFSVNCLSLSTGSLSSGGTGAIHINSSVNCGTNGINCKSISVMDATNSNLVNISAAGFANPTNLQLCNFGATANDSLICAAKDTNGDPLIWLAGDNHAFRISNSVQTSPAISAFTVRSGVGTFSKALFQFFDGDTTSNVGVTGANYNFGAITTWQPTNSSHPGLYCFSWKRNRQIFAINDWLNSTNDIYSTMTCEAFSTGTYPMTAGSINCNSLTAGSGTISTLYCGTLTSSSTYPISVSTSFNCGTFPMTVGNVLCGTCSLSGTSISCAAGTISSLSCGTLSSGSTNPITVSSSLNCSQINASTGTFTTLNATTLNATNLSLASSSVGTLSVGTLSSGTVGKIDCNSWLSMGTYALTSTGDITANYKLVYVTQACTGTDSATATELTKSFVEISAADGTKFAQLRTSMAEGWQQIIKNNCAYEITLYNSDGFYNSDNVANQTISILPRETIIFMKNTGVGYFIVNRSSTLMAASIGGTTTNPITVSSSLNAGTNTMSGNCFIGAVQTCSPTDSTQTGATLITSPYVIRSGTVSNGTVRLAPAVSSVGKFVSVFNNVTGPNCWVYVSTNDYMRYQQTNTQNGYRVVTNNQRAEFLCTGTNQWLCVASGIVM